MRIKLLSNHWRIPLLFQSRVYCDCSVGVTVQELLSSDFGLSLDYIEQHVETVFLNGQPLDDLNKAVIQSGDRLVLAAGLPGATGICMRRKSPLQSYRAGISQQQTGQTQDPDKNAPQPASTGAPSQINEKAKPGKIELALFSLLMKELYAHFMQRGIWLTAQALSDVLVDDQECRIWLDAQNQGQDQADQTNWRDSTREEILHALAELPPQEQVWLSSV